jgi:hypothetical protein
MGAPGPGGGVSAGRVGTTEALPGVYAPAAAATADGGAKGVSVGAQAGGATSVARGAAMRGMESFHWGTGRRGICFFGGAVRHGSTASLRPSALRVQTGRRA